MTGIRGIGYGAFSGCRGLKSVTIPDSVTSIGWYAFSGCSGLTSVTIPDSVTSIGWYAFSRCSGLTSVTIGNGVTSIGVSAFYGCSGLRSVYITDLAKWCGISFDGGYANPLQYAHNLYLNGVKVTDLAIPNSVTSIGSQAFLNCSGLTSVTIPDSVTSIEPYAFDGCSGLTSVTIGNGVTSIGAAAFSYCSGLTSVTIGSGVTSLGGRVFDGCSGLKSVTIPQYVCSNRMSSVFPSAYQSITNVVISGGVTSIGDYVFRDCSGLKSVALPDSVTSIGSSAFSGCSRLTSVMIPDSVTSIGDCVFWDCSGLKSVMIPDSVTSIGYAAFNGCSGLKSVTIPDSVTNISNSAFYGCSGLTSVTIGNSVTSIGGRAFDGCSGLKSVTIPQYVCSNRMSSVFPSAYQSITNVVISGGVTSIGDDAFSGCSGLTSVTIPDSVTSIGDGAFNNCGSSLFDTTTIPGLKLVDGWAVGKTGSLLGDLNLTGIRGIGCGAFSGCSGLKSVTMPDSVTSIGAYAFSDCNGLASVTIPDSVTGIGSYAFSGCSGLSSVYLPKKYSGSTSERFPSSTKIIRYKSNQTVALDADGGDVAPSSLLVRWRTPYGTLPTPFRDGYAFIGWTYGRQSISNETIVSAVDDHVLVAQWKGKPYKLTFNANGGTGGMTEMQDCGTSLTAPTVTRTGYTFTGWSPSVPSTMPAGNTTYTAQWQVNQYTVTFNANGGAGGKSGRQNFGSAIVAPTVTREWCTFAGWSPAVAATVPANNVTYTAQWARWGDSISASKLGGKTMRELYPADYAHMTTVILEEGITELPIGFFDGCDKVESVTWSSTLVDFGIDAIPPKILQSLSYDANGFMIYRNWILDYKNRGAEAVTIPNGIVGIGHGAFAEMYDLETVSMPESLVCIAKGAFEGCTYIQEIVFKSGLRHVGAEAFRDCTSLLRATFADGVETIGSYAFGGCWQMQSVQLPATLRNVGSAVFSRCDNLTGVTVPTHVATMNSLFPSSYSRIESVVVADGETSIMSGMFAGCSRLSGGATQTDMLVIPSTITNVGDRAFQNCVSLTSIVLPDSVASLGDSAFAGCSALWNVTLSRNLEAIPRRAFYGCSSLESMIVPASVSYLGDSFFSGRSDALPGDAVHNAIYFLGNAPECEYGVYSDVSGDLTTYVVQDSRGWDGRAGSRALPSLWRGYPITYWTPARFDVTFDANGGRFDSMGGSTWSEQQIKDTGYTLPSVEPVRPGWAFEGWWTAPMGGGQVKYTTKVTATRSHTLYAHWRSLGESMTVTFNSNGGTVVTPGSQDYVPGQTFGQFPVPTRRGYTFQGWWTEAVNGVRMTEATAVPAADMELFAHWAPISYYVRFNPNGGKGDAIFQMFTYDLRQALNVHEFSRTGFAFSGWAIEPSGQVRYAEGAIIVNLEETQDAVFDLYAVWSGSGYSIRFDSNGGTGIMDNQTIAVGETQALWKNAFARPGYVFTGWAMTPSGNVSYRDGASVKNLATENGATVSLYAVWKTSGQTMRITFDASGGSVSPAYWDCVAGTTVESFPTPTRSGFVFDGWYTAANGGVKVTSIARVSVALKLFAHWISNGGVAPGPSTYTVMFNANGGSVLPATCTVAGGVAIGTLPTPIRTGYTFVGWFTAANGGSKVTASTKVTANVTYYAHWTPSGGGTTPPRPVVVLELYEMVDGAAPATAASVYDGCLVDARGNVAGSIQIKIGKTGKDGKAAVKATVMVGAAKKSLKADGGMAAIAEDGPTSIRLVGGEACEVTLGAEGLSGTYGPYLIDGARNFFTSKDKGEAGDANDLLAKWLGPVNVAWDGGSASVSVAKKGKVRVALTLADGTKATANGQLLVGDEWLCVPVVVTKKMNIAFTLWLPHSGGAAVVEGLPGDVVAGKPGSLKAGAKFHIDAEEFSARWEQRALPYLPNGVPVSQNGTKWMLPKAGKVAYQRGGTEVDSAKLGENPSALKFTYKAKEGSFKGSFKVYADNGGRLKATNVSVSGVVVEGVGYGTAKVKNAGAVPIRIE